MTTYRPRPVSGFPEWLPEARLVELSWIDTTRRIFESHGFAGIETPAVEEIEVLLAKGEIDKEIYTLARLHDEDGSGKDARLALHYDLTVPTARYVAQHFNELTFPFKRWQIQKSWRGERPQEGRYREFLQADVDVLMVDHLPLAFDADVALIAAEVLLALPIGRFRISLSNRKILQGFLSGLGVEGALVGAAVRTLDKQDKLGAAAVERLLVAEVGFNADQARRALALTQIKSASSAFAGEVRALGVSHPALEEGLDELAFVIDTLAGALPQAAGEVMVADLSIARGFDYYTGTVLEARLLDIGGAGSVCGGGRYDDLAAGFINRKIPGVGISIGLSRLFGKLLGAGQIELGAKTPTQVLVVLPSEEQRGAARATAGQLRQRGFKVEVYHAPQKLARQLQYAERKGIPYVWFPPFEVGGAHEVKTLFTGSQAQADPAAWSPSTG